MHTDRDRLGAGLRRLVGGQQGERAVANLDVGLGAGGRRVEQNSVCSGSTGRFCATGGCSTSGPGESAKPSAQSSSWSENSSACSQGRSISTIMASKAISTSRPAMLVMALTAVLFS